MTPAQRARRAQDDLGHWQTRANSSKPPNVHPEVWQTLSAQLRRALANDYRKSQWAQTIGTQTGAVAVIE
eukprot:1040452-Heterocapsa_arctica.AAC.1